MKTNKFKDVRIPSKGEYFNTGRFMQEKGQYGGEENGIQANGTAKIQNVADLEKATRDKDDMPE